MPRTVHANLILLKTELNISNLDDALACFQELGSRWQDDPSQSAAPSHVAANLTELASRQHHVDIFLSTLKADAPLTEEAVHPLHGENVRLKDAALMERGQKLDRDPADGFPDHSHGLPAMCPSGEQEQTLAQGAPIASRFATALTSVRAQTGNVAMADKLHEHLQDEKLNVVPAVIRLYRTRATPTRRASPTRRS